MSSITQRPENPLILALDTSASLGSVALSLGDQVLSNRAFEAEHGHSQRLLPAIESVFNETGRRPAEVDLFAVVIGPGSFTGLRVSLACLRGLAGQTRCFGALATDVAAWAARGQGVRILAITDLFHGEVFACVHDEEGVLASNHESGPVESVLGVLRDKVGERPMVVGSATRRHRDALTSSLPGLTFRDLPEGLAPHLASLASVRASEATTSHASEVLPFYLRDPLTRGLLNTQPKKQ